MIDRLLPGSKEKFVRRLLGYRDQARAVYFSHPKLEIVLIPHDAFAKVSPSHDREVLILRNAWYPDDVAEFVKKLSLRMGGPNKNIHYLSNTEEIHWERLKWGLNSHFININCFIDESIFKPAASREAKLYDAVAIGRFSWHKHKELKRHDLMSEIRELALLDPVHGTTDAGLKQKYCSRSNCEYFNRFRLSPQEVARVLQRSHCGLILSAHEGACRASCEYLAAGLPVVTTPSVGGRDVWFDEYNCILVEPDPRAVKEAVEFLKSHPRDPEVIRGNFLKKAHVFRERFKNELIAPILEEHGIEPVVGDFLRDNPFFWWPEEQKRREMGTSDVALEFQDFGIGNISPSVIDHILTNVRRGANILEFGSGLGSRELSKAYNVISIEHDTQFVDCFHGQYVSSELQADGHYREADCRRALSMHRYDVVLIDGPPAYKQEDRTSRLGFQRYVDSFSPSTIFIFDDVNRWWDCLNLLKSSLRLKRDIVVIEDGSKSSAILTQERLNSWTLLRLLYLLFRSISYRYDGGPGSLYLRRIRTLALILWGSVLELWPAIDAAEQPIEKTDTPPDHRTQRRPPASR